MAFKKAVREQIYPKIALIGPSGAGKSYTALRLATGYVARLGNGKKIYYIDTEGGRGKYYADKFDYEYCELEEPYSPERYVEMIDDALSSEDIGVLIVDSATQEWSGKGGLLEQHNNMPGNSYTNWAKLTPRHNKFVDKLLYAPVCIITTVRGKDEYVLEEKNGKQVPKKVGVGGDQRNTYEYEMTLAFNIDQNSHVATASKDNTGLFDNVYNVLTEQDGSAIYDWANSGETPERPQKPPVTVDDLHKEVIEIAKSHGGSKDPKVMEIMKKYVKSGNPNAIKDADTLNKLIDELKNMEDK